MFDVEVLFLGLMLFCVSGDRECGHQGEKSVFLVRADASQQGMLCGERLEGDHKPRLVVDVADATYLNNQMGLVKGTPEFYTCDDQRVLRIFNLNGLELCFAYQGGPSDLSFARGRGAHQRKPNPFRTDVDAYDWIGSLTKMDSRVKGLRQEVRDPVQTDGTPNPLIASRIEVRSGKFLSASLGQYTLGNNTRHWLEWGLASKRRPHGIYEELNSYDGTDFPKAMSGRPELRIPALKHGFIIKECGEAGRVLAVISRPSGIASIRITNDILEPDTDHDYREDVFCNADKLVEGESSVVEHYLWLYNLTVQGAKKRPWGSTYCECAEYGGTPHLPLVPQLAAAKGSPPLSTTADPYCPPADFP